MTTTAEGIRPTRLRKRPWGSGHTYAWDGHRLPGVTSVLNVMNKRALPDWYAKQAAGWAATHVDLLTALGDDAWVRQATAAPRDVANKAADRGRDTHSHAMALLSGETPDVAPDVLPYVEQAARFMDEWNVVEIAAERPCVNTQWRYAGTFDLVCKLRDGATWLLDYKTGKGPYNTHGLQNAAYSACDLFQIDDDHDAPMPHVDRLGMVMLRPDHYEVIPVTADPARLVAYFYRAMDLAAFDTNTSGQNPRWPIFGEPMGVPA